MNRSLGVAVGAVFGGVRAWRGQRVPFHCRSCYNARVCGEAEMRTAITAAEGQLRSSLPR
jgi:hypothetical protein